MSVADDLRVTLERLRTKGWRQHAIGEFRGPNCLYGAMIHTADHHVAYATIEQIITEQYSDRSDAAIGPFNDHPDTTFADIERVLEKAILRAEEAEL